MPSVRCFAAVVGLATCWSSSGPLGAQALSGYTLPVTPRLAEGAHLATVATAMIDLSDGLATDVRRLANASGTGAVVELERLPRVRGASIEQAACGGEDYELLAAVPADAPLPDWVTVVRRPDGGTRGAAGGCRR